ncbi:hypothetical protein BDF21DRAFT_396201 [Thamnidium elegans]|nr:hypothetical protein BDF21DRAFT_396201 [Thamnidium elegans]
MFRHMDALFNFYGLRTATIKWNNYVASQKNIEKAVNILLNGSKRYNQNRRRGAKKNRRKKERGLKKIPSYRNRRHSKGISMNTSINLHIALKKALYEEIIGRNLRKVIVGLIIFGDELKKKRARQSLETCVTASTTSSIANFREEKILGNCCSWISATLRRLSLKFDTDGKSSRIHQILIWNHDVTASKNMLIIARSIWKGQGRPNVFKRPIATFNVVAWPHSGETQA